MVREFPSVGRALSIADRLDDVGLVDVAQLIRRDLREPRDDVVRRALVEQKNRRPEGAPSDPRIVCFRGAIIAMRDAMNSPKRTLSPRLRTGSRGKVVDSSALASMS